MLKLLQLLQSWALSRNALKSCYSKFTRLSGLRPNPTKAETVKSISAAMLAGGNTCLDATCLLWVLWMAVLTLPTWETGKKLPRPGLPGTQVRPISLLQQPL
jgi:hypothetical protein